MLRSTIGPAGAIIRLKIAFVLALRWGAAPAGAAAQTNVPLPWRLSGLAPPPAPQLVVGPHAGAATDPQRRRQGSLRGQPPAPPEIPGDDGLPYRRGQADGQGALPGTPAPEHPLDAFGSVLCHISVQLC